MDQKQKFAQYVIAKRKAAGLSQRELADQLYVTNTAVSKWERGLSYPDITLISPICRALSISPQEFVDACDDMGARRAKRESGYYKRIARIYHTLTLSLYALGIAACLIVDLTLNRALTWSLLVIASILLAASVFNLPYLSRHIPEKYQPAAKLCAYGLPLCFLLLLLLSTGVYAPLNWFVTALLGILLGYSLFVAPFAARAVPGLSREGRIIILYLSPLVLICLLLLNVCLRSGGVWFFTAFFSVLTAYCAIILPILFSRLTDFTRKWNCLFSAVPSLVFAALLVYTICMGYR